LNNAFYSLTTRSISLLRSSFIISSKKAPKKAGFAVLGSNNPSIKGDSPPIVDNNPGFDTCGDELSNDNTKEKTFTNCI
jgi:hypothetical protein